MEITDYNVLINISKEITLKAMDNGLIQTDINNPALTAHNIANFYNEISNALFNLEN